MSELRFLAIKGTCHCGCNQIKNLRYWPDSLCQGWWAECAKCKTTRFLPEEKKRIA